MERGAIRQLVFRGVFQYYEVAAAHKMLSDGEIYV